MTTASVVFEGVDETRLMAVTTAVKSARAAAQEHGPRLAVHVMADCTMDGLETFLDFHALRGGLDAQVVLGRYNIFHQDLVNPASDLHALNPRLLVLALVRDSFASEPETPVEAVTARLEELFRLAAERTSAAIAVNTFVLPVADYDRGDSAAGRIGVVNDWIRGFVEANRARFFLCDWNRYVAAQGREACLDWRYWYLAKAPFKPAFLTLYAADLAKIGRAVLGLAKKVLVLDCDGTLWGGVLGEDGLDGVALNPGDYPGNVFHAVQRQILELGRRGVLLALCSKNNAADVLHALETHPHCLLKPGDFAAMKVDWENKAGNIAQLARELNLGLDSFVFVDDNPFEVESLRALLPQVETVLVPKALYLYPEAIARMADRFFYPASQTAEDAGRTRLYQARREAEEVRAGFTDMASYLRSLDISIDIHPIAAAEVARVAQLTQKTNQFNVHKQVYGEAEIASAVDSADRAVYVGVVGDRFGALGLTNVCILDRRGEDEAAIDAFLMSCRVFERNLEYVMLDHVIGEARRRWRVSRLRACFVPSAKNKPAETFFDNAGFALERVEDGVRHYVLELAAYQPKIFDYIRKIDN
ncbi:MAG: HAD-IIIC family phosphatase [Phaeospirillum sp.]|nr:HAD-IIIC family phosphatase [Phaeospirillum sp.]